MNVAVCVPFRPVDDTRAANLARTIGQWGDWRVLLGDHYGDPFSAAAARNAAAAQADDADVLVFADSDILLDGRAQAESAARAALHHDAYVVCYSRLHILDRAATLRVLAGDEPRRFAPAKTHAGAWICCFAVSRTLFDRCGGFDERFPLCGWEDVAFLACAVTLGGNQRIDGDAYHLDHDRTQKRDPVRGNERLARAYQSATGDRKAMLALLAERFV